MSTQLVNSVKAAIRELDDAFDVLELVHVSAGRLRDLAGDSLTITVAAAEPAEPHREGHRVQRFSPAGKEAEERVTAYLETHGGRACQAELASGLGFDKKRVYGALGRLEAAGAARRTEETARAPGQSSGRKSPVWELVQGPEEASSEEARRPDGDASQADTAPIGASPAPPVDLPEDEDEDDRGAPGPDTTIALSARTRKSIERAEAEERALRALGEPPESSVLDRLRERALSISELAAAEATSRVFVAEELHVLKPWLVKLPDGKYRAIERLRTEAA